MGYFFMNLKAKIDYVKRISDEEELFQYIDFYNWDDGFDIPMEVSKNKNCTLPIALFMFELADGYTYLETKEVDQRHKEWSGFVTELYRRVMNNEFPLGKMPYAPQLNKVQIYKMNKVLPEEEHIFITPIKAVKELIEWKYSEEMLSLYEIFLQGRAEFPAKCPICSRQSGHIYLNRDEDSERGGMWAWCSECNSFAHAETNIPQWWYKPTFIDKSNLCAENADEPNKYIASIDDMVNQCLQSYCFSKDVCKYCIRKEYELPKFDKCPDCGEQTMMVSLDGPCLLLCCSNCGYEVVGASFFPPCDNDNLEYTVTVKNVEKEKKIRVSKLFRINVKELLDAFRANNKIEITLSIDEAMALLHGLKELEVDYEVTPDIVEKYPDIMDCKFRCNKR